MRLVRFATVTFHPAQTKWKYTKFERGDVEINTFVTTKDKLENPDTLLLQAEIDLKSKPEIKENVVIIPEESRRELERCIEDVANIIAVSEMCKRLVSSPSPCIAFKSVNKEEREWLDSTKGIRYTLKMIPSFRFSVQDEISKNNFLSDRLDGVAMLAEALANPHLTGKLHEFMRLFERAFTLSSAPLIKPLSDFLIGSKLKITSNNVAEWIVDLRHPATHADKKEEFVLESDLREHIHLIEQAAYDVLFNKEEWRNTSIKRREILNPISLVQSDGVSVVQKGSYGQAFMSQLLDPFGVFPVNLAGGLTSSMSDDLWFKKIDDEK